MPNSHPAQLTRAAKRPTIARPRIASSSPRRSQPGTASGVWPPGLSLGTRLAAHIAPKRRGNSTIPTQPGNPGGKRHHAQQPAETNAATSSRKRKARLNGLDSNGLDPLTSEGRVGTHLGLRKWEAERPDGFQRGGMSLVR